MGAKIGDDQLSLAADHGRIIANSRTEESHQPTPLWRHRYARSLVITDTLSVVAAVTTAQWIRFGGSDLAGSSYTQISIAPGPPE